MRSLKTFSIREFVRTKWRDRMDPEVVFDTLCDLEKVAPARGWPFYEVLPACIQECPGASALKEDFMLWVEQGGRLLRQHRDFGQGVHFPKHWASMLHSQFRYRMDKVFRCAIPGAVVIREGGGVVSPEGELIEEAFFLSGRLRRSQYPPPKEHVLPGNHVSLLTVWGEKNMGHYFFDAMLRTAALESVADYRFLVPPVVQSWHRGLYEVAGIRPDQLVPVNAPCVRVENLEVCHISSSGSKPRRELLLGFRERALSNVLGGVPPSRRDRRLFVDRSGAKRRKLVNQDQLLPVLKDYGFEVIRWEDCTMAEQVRLASEASVIAGPHGTSLLNSLYCKPGATLLEIFNPHWWDATTLRQCSLVGHKFWYCFGENSSSDWDTTISPTKLARVLDYMLGNRQFDVGAEEIPS